MPCVYQHDFFVSYPHVPGENRLNEFVEELVKAIRFQLAEEPYEPVYRDLERLKPGFVWKTELSHALCHSRCMLAVYTDGYFSREYCLREWDAMVDLEIKRVGATSRRMIIPILLRAAKDVEGKLILPSRMQELEYEDFSSISWPRQQFRNLSTKNKVLKLVERVDDLKRRSKDPGVDCASYEAFLVSTPQPPRLEAYGGSWG
jgi:hypothetical protein